MRKTEQNNMLGLGHDEVVIMIIIIIIIISMC